MPAFLNPGEAFPELKLQIAGGGEVALPDYCETRYTIALFYRGHW